MCIRRGITGNSGVIHSRQYGGFDDWAKSDCYNVCILGCVDVIVNIAGNHKYPGIWDGVYYFKLADYPKITNWELTKLLWFYNYEKKHNRNTEFVCDNHAIITAVKLALSAPDSYIPAQMPNVVPGCTACKQIGCLTEYLCHGTAIESAKSIFECGKILSAVNARGKPAQELQGEKRQASKDPLDYFDYVMMSWGSCIAGDSLVMERMLGKFPNETEFSTGFKPGVRFFFKYDTMVNHIGFVNDGYHPGKVKDEILLSESLYCCIIPEHHRLDFTGVIPFNLADKVIYVENDCKDIYDWTKKVYGVVCSYSNSPLNGPVRAENSERFNAFSATGGADLK